MAHAETDRFGVLFVCLGNICRSPLARAIFADLAKRRGLSDQFDIDSCGTGAWHIGEPADARAQLVASRHGVELVHTARQIDPETDFDRFGLLLGMDRANCATVLELGAPREKVRLIRSFDRSLTNSPEHGMDVPDPYYGSGDGFERVYTMLTAACEGLIDHVRRDPR